MATKANKQVQVVVESKEVEPISTPPALLQQAIASGAGIEVLERLMALQERWEANQAEKAFNAALADLRNDMPSIIKNRTVDYTSSRGHTYYKYEDLQAVTETLTPIMAQHGLSFRWRTQTDKPGEVTVTCIVSHRDGHSETTTLSAVNDQSGNKNDIQALGSAVTYLQRYTLKAALGIAAANDDDGDKSGEPKGGNNRPPERSNQPAPQSTGSRKYERNAAHNHLEQVIEDYCKAMGVDPKVEGKEILKKMSAFKGKDGNEVPGVSDVLELSEKRAIITRVEIEKVINSNRDWRAELGKAILDYGKEHNKSEAERVKILEDVTGEAKFSKITHDMARKGLEKFREEYKE